MNTRRVLLAISTLVAVAMTPTASFAASTEGSFDGPTKADYVKDEVLVTFKGGLPTRTIRAAVGADVGLEELSMEPISGMVRYRITDGRSVDEKLHALSARADVARVNRNWLGEYFFDPNDTYYWSHQWNLRKTDVPEAWDYASAAGDPGGSTRYMAIVDSGVDRDHEDLGYIYGWNFVDNNGQRGDGCSP